MDLTRFDFHALRFMESENVKLMTAEEVGQYILLLCAAWLAGKDATLPNNPAYLSRIARCAPGERVAATVMARFEVVDTPIGERLLNDTLGAEWERAIQRSQKKRNAVAIRWGNKRNTTVSQLIIPKPNQSNPNQSIPDQTKSDQAEPEEDMSLKTRINNAAGRKIIDSRNMADFNFLSTKYGKEEVVSDFISWYNNLPDDAGEYPAGAYLKIADERLKGSAVSAVVASNPEIPALIALVYNRTGRTARPSDLSNLLKKFTFDEIKEAFNHFTEGLDEFELKWASKNFFQDGAGEGVIIARRQKKEEEARQNAINKTSVEAGVAESRAEIKKMQERQKIEKELSDKLGDRPF